VTGAKPIKKILVVSQYFWPESFRVNEFVLELKNRGYVVEVLTSIPNYPGGRVFPDFALNKDKYGNYFGVKVHRVPQISRYSNKLSLALNYFSFVITACFYSLFKLRKRKFDLIFGVQLSPIFSMIPAILCKKLLGKPLHIWVLDIWPDSVIGGGIKSNLIISLLRKLCVLIYSSADILFLSSNGFKYKLNQMGVVAPKLVYFPQWIEADYLDGLQPGSSEDAEVRQLMSRWENKVIFTFTGNVGEAQDFPSVLEGLKKCRRLKDLVFLVIGDGRYKKELIKSIQSEGLDNTVFCLGQYPMHYMPLFYYHSAYLVLPLRDTAIFSYTLPGKVQSYMSSGKPLVGMVNGEAAQVIGEAGCGYVASAGDHDHFAGLLDLCCSLDSSDRHKLGSLGKSYAYKNFRLESLIDKVEENFRSS
jgi:glycosyltransferase involved in cell wall biosynthesis